ncbi:sister chromatid cohesion protein [Apiospora rasikravindrae]|uniref:Sister chromatid cohesion protein n=1 Tax=Apiospora rasikravindrae TaxID=990691 RepID=A0ABR1S1K7_9PEZI
MFYSHEILTDRQYGVATIWIVATIGSRSQTKRVTRKAIQDVEIQKAVEKIIEPGAPIALRLQGSLLLELNFHMNAFFKNMARNELDPAAGQGRRENLMIMDDPDFASGFIPQMPAFNANADMYLVNSNGRNNTQKTSSQMSPPSLMTPGCGSSSSQDRFQLQLDVPRSDTPDHNFLPQGLQGLSSGQKPAPLGVMGDEGDIFGGGELGPSADCGFTIAEDGSIVENAVIEPDIFGEELDLPPMPSIEGGDNLPQLAAQQPKMDEQGDIVMMDEQPLPDVEALPRAERDDQKAYDQTSPEADKQGAITQRKRKRRVIKADERLEISRNILRDWQKPDVYRENCCKPKRRQTTATEARKNAIHLTFGLGLGNIGQNLGIPGMIHPLAVQYSGDSLFTAMTGLEVFNDQDRGGRKRFRSASEDIEDFDGEGRRVRPRLEEQGDAEHGQQQQGRCDQNGDNVFGLGDDGLDQLSEVGRERQSALDDHPSSAYPWNRHSSAVPGSSVRGQQPQFGRDQPSSPLNKRAGSVQDIVRYSDSGDVGGGGLDFGFGGVGGDSNGSGSDQGGFFPLPAGGDNNDLNTQERNQYAREFLDREGANFLSYIEQTIVESGERRHDEDFELQRKWIGFDDVFVPARTDRATAAQAFYHVLGLVTKGRMLVEQVGMPQEPFGEIHVGIKID